MRILATSLLFAGCAKSIGSDKNITDDTADDSTVSAGEAIIDATSESYWVYFDLGTPAVVTPANPDDSTEWDIAFRRYIAKINGGVSGTGGMEVVPLPGVDFNTGVETPTDGWITDELDGDDENDLPEYALDSWWEYDSATHLVSTADTIFVVKSVETDLYKLKFLAYYDDAGTPGYIHMIWGDLDDTVVVDTGDTGDTGDDELACTSDISRVVQTDLGDGVTQTQANASTIDDLFCFDFGDGGMVTSGWDLALQKWTVYNTGEVARLASQDFDALTQAPASGYVTDDGSGSAFQTWYDYTGEPDHLIVPVADLVYVVHTEADKYFKMQFTSYYPEGDTKHSLPGYPTWKWAEISAP